MLAAAFIVLAVLAGAMTYTGFLVVGELAHHIGTGRFVAGLLLGVVFARFPAIRNGRLRIVGLLPKPVRRPLIVGLLALCLLSLLSRGENVPALFAGFTMTFVLAYPWLRKAVFDRVVSSFSKFRAGQNRRNTIDDNVIDGEFREKKD